MKISTSLFRRLLPALLLAGLALSSCEHRKDCDPKPKNRCGTPAPPSNSPGGNS